MEELVTHPLLCDRHPTEFGSREGLYEWRLALDYGRSSQTSNTHHYTRPNSVGYALGSSSLHNNGGYAGYAGHLGANSINSNISVNNVTSNNGQVSGSSWMPAVKIGFLDDNNQQDEDDSHGLIAFNMGREIFVYPYSHLPQSCEVGKPQDRRIYKGTCPTCHDFGTPIKSNKINEDKEEESFNVVTPFIIGFSGGQVQMLDPVRRDMSKLFNEERLIEKSRATCIKWVPSSGSAVNTSFLVSYASGNLYLYNVDLPNPSAGQNSTPNYQLFKQGSEGDYSVFTCKAKSSRNPVYKWQIGRLGSAINEFAFSPCGHFLAIVSQDGYMRLFNYDTMEIKGRARSYFGGFRCLTWSPDGKLILLGGEDDLVTVFSVVENRVVVRGRGHKSWVSSVAFDPMNFGYGNDSVGDALDFSTSDDEDMNDKQQKRTIHNTAIGGSRSKDQTKFQQQQILHPSSIAATSSTSAGVTCYRFGSVGEDTLLCLWDLSDDLLKQSTQMHDSVHKSTKKTDPVTFSSTSSKKNNSNNVPTAAAMQSPALPFKSKGQSKSSQNSDRNNAGSPFGSLARTATPPPQSTPSLSQRLASSLSFSDRGNKDHKRNFSLPGRSSSTNNSNTSSSSSAASTSDRIEWVQLGSPQCPRLNEVPMMEPIVLKRVASERLTSLVFRPDALVLACQDGWVHFWARPERSVEPTTNGSMGTGTIV